MCTNSGIEMVSPGSHWPKRSCLTSLQPVSIRVANVFSACTFPVWPAKRRVLQRAVCHLAARIDNNSASLDLAYDVFIQVGSNHAVCPKCSLEFFLEHSLDEDTFGHYRKMLV